MSVHFIRKGLDLPINGVPEQVVHAGAEVSHVAIMADDYPYMKPKMHVRVGDTVKLGQPVMEDRKAEGVVFTAPGAGTVVAIHRGERRRLISVVIELAESGSGEDKHAFSHFNADAELDDDKVRALLVESGLWTALRARPHDRVPAITETCSSIFVTAIDSRPHAGDPVLALQGREEDFLRGLGVLEHLTEGKIWLCKKTGAEVPSSKSDRVSVEEFEGCHPAGLVGTHIHALDPVHRGKTVWHVGAQDVVAIGSLFATGTLDVSRVVSLAGPAANTPRLLKTRLGASIDQLVSGETGEGEIRVVSGSVIGGRQAMGEQEGFLGRYDMQISVLTENREREFLGWLKPGGNIYSTVRAFVSSLSPNKTYDMTTTTNGSHRAMVPIGMFERVMPLDIMPTFLLRSLLVDDVERAEKLGALELAEEDLALCSFVSPGKEDYGVALRRNLTDIWKEG
ncbi:MAG: NADH:ubiquinone reductase (Na(+)-transporting) subunit A [Deltaproteobacteria bacterium]|nr:NADH:ubiquinone reductase (Na(+)-transporting) subunit A [Deltaproteobacteria bacterium]